MSFDGQETLQTPSGAALNLRFAHAAAPHAVVQLNHGLSEHSGRYARFAGFLAGRGFHVYAHDHRGHGLTTAPGAPAGSFGPGGGAAVIADVAAVHDRIAAAHPRLPVIVFGHSMGGLIALNFLFRHSRKVRAAAIWNANFSPGLAGRAALALLAWERFRLGSDAPSRLLPKLTFHAWARQAGCRTDADWLSRDDAEVDAFIADPLCGRDPSVGMWREVFGFIFAGADDRNLSAIRRNLPLNLAGGGADPATGGGRAVEALAGRMRRLGFSDLVCRIRPHDRHESLNELDRDTVMEDFARWARKAAREK